MTKENNASAFPVYLGNKKNWDLGMTLRDYFAAKAMQAIIEAHGIQYITFTEVHAKWAYDQADSMLAARGEQ